MDVVEIVDIIGVVFVDVVFVGIVDAVDAGAGCPGQHPSDACAGVQGALLAISLRINDSVKKVGNVLRK